MSLSNDQIKHIADLARLELSAEELEKYGSQLSAVLEYIEQLSEVNVEGVEPTAQVTGLANVLRDDKEMDWPENEIELALRDAPGREERLIKVKRVLE
jgi:aspartyl-tRNA(Asn)/glutamyl-tRNA(Gln) amidotransferase subunit C